jgi:hypothetical protein
MNDLVKELAKKATKQYLGDRGEVMSKLDIEKFAELILIEVIATIYGSDIKDKKQDKLVDKLFNKFGME